MDKIIENIEQGIANGKANAEVKSKLNEVLERLVARGENAYCRMISQARTDECLGWEAKIDHGKFGKPEMDAHATMNELLGKHRGLMDAVKLLREAL